MLLCPHLQSLSFDMVCPLCPVHHVRHYGEQHTLQHPSLSHDSQCVCERMKAAAKRSRPSRRQRRERRIEQGFFEGGDMHNCILHAVNNACGRMMMRYGDNTWMQQTFDTPLKGIRSYDQKQRIKQRERSVDLTYGLYEVQSVFNKMKKRPFNMATVRTGRTVMHKLDGDGGETFRYLALEKGITTLFYAGSLMEDVGHSIVVKYEVRNEEGMWFVYDSIQASPILLSAYTKDPDVMRANFSVSCAFVSRGEGNTVVDVGYVYDSKGTEADPITIE